MGTSGIATRGYLTGGATGGGGGSGPSGVVIFFMLIDDDGEAQAGVDLSGAGEIKISKNGEAFANRDGDAPTSVGRGLYYYIVDSGELPDGDGSVFLSVNKAGYKDPMVQERVGTTVTDAKSNLQTLILNILSQIESAISAAQTAINSNTDLDESMMETAIDDAVVAVNSHTDSAISVSDAAVESSIDDAVASINTHSDINTSSIESEITDSESTLQTAIDDAVISIDSHIDTATQSLDDTLQLIAGLHRRNSMLDGGQGSPKIQYNSRRLMTNARLRVFADAASLASATPGGADDNDGEIARYIMTGTDTGIGLVAVFTMTQVLP